MRSSYQNDELRLSPIEIPVVISIKWFLSRYNVRYIFAFEFYGKILKNLQIIQFFA